MNTVINYKSTSIRSENTFSILLPFKCKIRAIQQYKQNKRNQSLELEFSHCRNTDITVKKEYKIGTILEAGSMVFVNILNRKNVKGRHLLQFITESTK